MNEQQDESKYIASVSCLSVACMTGVSFTLHESCVCLSFRPRTYGCRPRTATAHASIVSTVYHLETLETHAEIRILQLEICMK